jgi:hypothetical protein
LRIRYVCLHAAPRCVVLAHTRSLARLPRNQVSQNLILESAKAVAATAAVSTIAATAAVSGVAGEAIPAAARQEVLSAAKAHSMAAAKVRLQRVVWTYVGRACYLTGRARASRIRFLASPPRSHRVS